MTDWSDWLTDALYRVRIMPAARAKLAAQPEAAQDRLRQMLSDVTAFADESILHGFSSRRDERRQLLHLGMGRLTLRYSIDDQERTLTVHHVVVIPESGSGYDPSAVA